MHTILVSYNDLVPRMHACNQESMDSRCNVIGNRGLEQSNILLVAVEFCLATSTRFYCMDLCILRTRDMFLVIQELARKVAHLGKTCC